MAKNKKHGIYHLDAKRRRLHEYIVVRYWELDRDFVDLWQIKERAVIELKLCRRRRVRDILETLIVKRLERELVRISRQRDKYGRWAASISYWTMLHDLATERMSASDADKQAAEELQTINFV